MTDPAVPVLDPGQVATLLVIAHAELDGTPVRQHSTAKRLYVASHGLNDAVVGALVVAGLVTAREHTSGDYSTYHVTDAGRTWINERGPRP